MTTGLTRPRRPRPRSLMQPEGSGLPREDSAEAGAPRRMRMVVREAALLGGLLLVYQATRLLGGHDVGAAFSNAQRVLDLERSLGLPAERAVQAMLLTAEPLVRAANAYYAAAHLPVTVVALLWLLLSRPEFYRRTRQALVGATAAALAVYLLLPVAPPRMLPGFVDTAAVYGQSVYGTTGASALTNQYAALPSLHVGWAVLVATACIVAGRTRWRWLWLVHPTLTTIVVIVTANHFWLDAVLGAALVAVAWQLARPPAAIAVPARPGELCGDGRESLAAEPVTVPCVQSGSNVGKMGQCPR